MTILSELLDLHEAQGTIVVADLEIEYITDTDRDKTVTVKVYHDAKTPEAAKALLGKMTSHDGDPIEVDNDNHGDALHHYAQNAGTNFSAVHGSAYIENARLASKPPAGRKVFSFQPKDLGF